MEIKYLGLEQLESYPSVERSKVLILRKPNLNLLFPLQPLRSQHLQVMLKILLSTHLQRRI